MHRKNNGGFTIIELVVVIAILIGLSTVIALNGADSRDVTRLNTATLKVESLITQTQSFGNSGRAYPPGGTAPEDFDKGYGIYFTEGSNIVELYGGRGDLDTPPDGYQVDEEKHPGEGTYESITLDGVVVSDITPGSEAHILFRRGDPEAHIYINGPNRREDVRITLASDLATKDIIVNKTGLIYIDE